MIYKFPQFKTEITDPTITVVSVTDNIMQKQCAVEILLTTSTCKFGVSLSGFAYAETWNDTDIENWVAIELENYKV